MHDRRSPLPKLVAALRAVWATRRGKLSVALLVLGLWQHWVLALPIAYYGIRLLRALMGRLLWSVRAKLLAFYLYAAFLPILLLAVVLLCVGYIVLGEVSARVVESRLERQVEWAEQRLQAAESAYWRHRAAGDAPAAAVTQALDQSWGDVQDADFGFWATDGAGRLVATRGRVTAADLHPPKWLRDRRFVGLASGDSSRFDLRTRLHLVDGKTTFDLGSVLPVDTLVLNRGLNASPEELRAGLGPPGRSVLGSEALPDSTLRRQGIVCWISRDTNIRVTSTAIHVEDAPGHSRTDSLRNTLDMRWGPRRDRAADTLRAEAPAAAGGGEMLLRSRYPLLRWFYFGYPLDWETGRTLGVGPAIVVMFSVEGATRALLRSGVGVDSTIVIFAGCVIAFLLLLQIGATLRGFLYARAISGSVARLDRGVRAIRGGDFGYRIAPDERDQLGAMAFAFNDMSGRLQGLIEERATHEVVERELAIARDVQARLFPERTPYAPFLEAAGMCLPARMVSGDYYDFVEVAGGYDAIVADVSGKGMSAALLMASLHSALRSLYLRQGRGARPDPAEVLTHLNQHLHQYVEPSRFVTLFLARYLGDGKLVYCNAGHNPAALVQDGRVEWLTSGGLMLGPFPDLVYESATVAVRPGDVLCLYTDGVTEAESPSGEQFGEERLAAVLRDGAGLTPRQLLATVEQKVRAWCGEHEPGDDLTLVVLRVLA